SHRLAMLERVTAAHKSYMVSDIEAKRASPSYSIDTIRILISRIGTQADLFFIIGVDAFLEIATWKRYEELPTLVSFVIITRPGYAPDKVGDVISRNFIGYEFNASDCSWSAPHNRGSFILQDMEPVPVSSTEIRRKVRLGQDITGLVPQAVQSYIKNHGLYI
ncbi:MAG: nicotinate (nicotinamide) nucleotide adenylyltransferase, partial [Desulfobulbales bacterium]|nr:nicotinate (nicotinamide) nucleotide adenylyltransferase [Desulfobulbales bacterium]